MSEFSKKEILKHFNCRPGKIAVIKNGVRQYMSWLDESRVKERYGLPNNYLLFVGNVKRHKNIMGFLKAYLKLSDDFKINYKVVIVGKKDGFITGDSELFSWIQSNAILGSNVIFTGYVEDADLDSVYHYASLFVFPSFYEGFGLPPLEAMINGCPVIASKAACIPDVCEDAVLYFNPNSPEDIKDKIEKVLTSTAIREKLISSGANQAKKYLWEASCKMHNVVFFENFVLDL